MNDKLVKSILAKRFITGKMQIQLPEGYDSGYWKTVTKTLDVLGVTDGFGGKITVDTGLRFLMCEQRNNETVLCRYESPNECNKPWVDFRHLYDEISEFMFCNITIPDNPNPSPPPPPKGTSRHKTDYTLLDSDFLRQMALNMEDGLKDGREADDWKSMDWDEETERKYKAKLLRHYHDGDPDYAAIACNAMILWCRNES